MICLCWGVVLSGFVLVLCGCMNGASPVRFVLFLLYMCAIQNLVCVVCVVVSCLFVCDRGHKSK